ncbi:P-loop containing nucleoside triphosphate hydrolase protein [Exidia glandulosa HHB12029]|uniref:p-loop containing nucleoside triphosphate hydrolase protein n=1 Tax=Exidia glandulosa HHB12029 TaxID=1314781 RepID=A0A166APR8_EXIGL|nr:P-loop containing nucleoside triphosphate hydrolase protein [Exidia glandulosa HHB12029]
MTSGVVLRVLRRPLQPHHVAYRRVLSVKATKHEPLVLRPYQENCIQACLDALDSGCTRIGVSLPTGAGKTTVFLSLLERLKSDGKKAIVIVNSVELAKQAAAQAERLFPDMTVEIEQGQKHVATANADITIATYQTLVRGTRIHKFDPAEIKAVIVDEAHHAAAPSYQRVLGHFDPHMKVDIENRPPSPVPIIGFSATFNRHDGLALGSAFDRIVYHRDFLEMIKGQWLCTVRFTTVKVALHLSNVKLSGVAGDFKQTSLAHVVNTESVNQVVLQAWIDRASTRKSTLIFCIDVAHVRDLTEVFRQAGIDARYLYSGTPYKERTDLLTAFRAGEYPVLVNCSILTEGADIPNIDCVILARPTRSRNLFAQMIGRGMRLSPQTGKEDCHILDFVDSTTRVNGVITTPSLFGLTPEEDVEDVSLEELEKRAEKILTPRESSSSDVDIAGQKSITYQDYESPFALAADSSGAPHISELSSHAWCGVSDDIYVLQCLAKGFIRIQPIVGGDLLYGKPSYVAVYIATNTSSNAPHIKAHRILTAANLADAVRGADQYAKNRVCPGRMASALFRSATWRKKPASDLQKEFIVKWWLGSTTAAEYEHKRQQVSKLTKGDVSNFFIRLKHGAAVRSLRWSVTGHA